MVPGCLRNLEWIWYISSSAIGKCTSLAFAEKFSAVRTERFELYLCGIISFMFDVECLYKLLLLNCSKGVRQRMFLNLMQQRKGIATEIHPLYKDFYPMV